MSRKICQSKKLYRYLLLNRALVLLKRARATAPFYLMGEIDEFDREVSKLAHVFTSDECNEISSDGGKAK